MYWKLIDVVKKQGSQRIWQERREMADSRKDGKGKKGREKTFTWVYRRGGNFRRGDRSVQMEKRGLK
jgi:hypothetical protein